jgi:hypothetical protein
MKTPTKKASISLDFKLMDASSLAQFADGTVIGLTGNASFSAPPVPLTTITSQTGALRTLSGQRSSGNKSTALTKQEANQAGTLMQSLTSNGHYVEDTANTAGNGDVAVAEQLILTSGYHLKGHAAPAPRGFEIVGTQTGWVHARVAKTQTGAEGHLWRFGITPTKGIPPTTLVTRFTLAVDLIIADIPSGSILGIQHASILPTPRAAKKAAATAKGASATAISASGHVVVSFPVADPYQWTGFIYALIP